MKQRILSLLLATSIGFTPSIFTAPKLPTQLNQLAKPLNIVQRTAKRSQIFFNQFIFDLIARSAFKGVKIAWYKLLVNLVWHKVINHKLLRRKLFQNPTKIDPWWKNPKNNLSKMAIQLLIASEITFLLQGKSDIGDKYSDNQLHNGEELRTGTRYMLKKPIASFIAICLTEVLLRRLQKKPISMQSLLTRKAGLLLGVIATRTLLAQLFYGSSLYQKSIPKASMILAQLFRGTPFYDILISNASSNSSDKYEYITNEPIDLYGSLERFAQPTITQKLWQPIAGYLLQKVGGFSYKI